ncbi:MULTISPECIES: hypothetical protein [Streptomyces]|uniref:hypothetical protein n=1 Tax=Streptomyces TaxID=1883 RepID=UPI002248A003|nr:hypothetical protein [Streptomyces sp. JHD 1]MCX2971313.1 hypothetical protein [Streptomyces sp. JHD 1]
MELERVPAPERGATRIADKVIAKIAAQAAHEALDTGTDPGRHQPGARSRHASVSGRRGPGPDGELGSARLRVAVELPYPSDIGAQTRAVRRRVVSRVRELLGYAVPDVAVDVERLVTAQQPAGGGEGRVR